MDYRKITCKESKQYKLIHSDIINVCSDGLLRSNDNYIGIAIGSYYGGVGDKFKLTLSTGKNIKVIVVEEKADSDTINGANHACDGSMIEFVVDCTKIPEKVLKSGNMNDLEAFNGNIVRIERV